MSYDDYEHNCPNCNESENLELLGLVLPNGVTGYCDAKCLTCMTSWRINTHGDPNVRILSKGNVTYIKPKPMMLL